MKYWSIVRISCELALVALAAVLLFRAHTYAQPVHAEVVRRVPMQQKVVALTFDDGPHPVYTPEILRILAHYHIKATFFMIGNRMERYPDLVKEVAAQGNVIGNHSFTHPHNIKALSREQMIQQLKQCNEELTRLTGHGTNLFRPPLGRLDSSILQIVSDQGYDTILWTVCADNNNAPTPQLMAQRVFRYIKPGGIILAHDGRFPIRWKDVAATPLIISGLERRGYRFVTVPELLAMRAHARPTKAAHTAPAPRRTSLPLSLSNGEAPIQV